ncbi:MAG TPA: hypothetical protein PLI18_06070 [Pirellulaceae bacterium]|nr:hypothetical protein [Pirellulaceae bacterium]
MTADSRFGPVELANGILTWWQSVVRTEGTENVTAFVEGFRATCLNRSRLDATDFESLAAAATAAAGELWREKERCTERVAMSLRVDAAQLSDAVDRKYGRWLTVNGVPRFAVLPGMARKLALEIVRQSTRRRASAVARRPTGRPTVEAFNDPDSPDGFQAISTDTAITPLLLQETSDDFRDWLLECPDRFRERLSQIDWNGCDGQFCTLLLDLRLELLSALADGASLASIVVSEGAGDAFPTDRVALVEWWQPWSEGDRELRLCPQLTVQGAWHRARALFERGIELHLRARLLESLVAEGFAIDSAAYRQRLARAKERVRSTLDPAAGDDLLEPLRSARRIVRTYRHRDEA